MAKYITNIYIILYLITIKFDLKFEFDYNKITIKFDLKFDFDYNKITIKFDLKFDFGST